MARPPKLDDRQKAEIGRRLAAGESGRQLAKEFKVSEGTIRSNITTHPATIRDVATRLASAELDLKALPVSAQGSVRTLADQLQGISKGLAQVASDGVETGKILGGIALQKAKGLTKDSDMEELRETVAFQEGANRALAPATTILAANKNATEDQGSVTVYSGVPRG